MSWSFGSAYDGANWSEKRGYVDWNTLDTRLELDSFSREELVRRVRWLSKNIGFMKGVVNGLADLVGYMMPQARTGDAEWNAAAEVNYHARAGAPLVFDAAGKFDVFDAQLLQTRTWLRDGELLTALTETPSKGARVAFFESHRLANPEDASDRWLDGVLATPQGRHARYAIKDQSGKAKQFDARNIIYFGEWESCGHHRSVPPLAHAVNHAVDITEIWSDTKHAIKTAGLFGAYTTNTDEKGARQRSGLGSNLVGKESPSGEAYNSAEVWAGSGSGGVPDLPKGKDLKILHDSRPHPNIRDLIRDLIRDIALGTGCPVEIIWELSGLNGPGVRFMLERLDRWISRRQKPLRAWNTRHYVYHMAKEMKAGRLRECRDPNWWKVAWIGQKSMTIDRSRDKDQLDLYDGGMTTLSDYYAQRGQDWEEQVKQKILERKLIREECARQGLEPDEVFRPRQGAAGIGASESSESGAAGDPSEVVDIDENMELGDYGIAVRAGVVTPQVEDEDYFRETWGLPKMSKAARKAWLEERNTRRPITLKDKDEAAVKAKVSKETKPEKQEDE
jgi:capsid protein